MPLVSKNRWSQGLCRRQLWQPESIELLKKMQSLAAIRKPSYMCLLCHADVKVWIMIQRWQVLSGETGKAIYSRKKDK